MTSTSITTVGGLVVVTQVIPQDEKAIPLQAAAPTNAAPAQPPSSQTPPAAPAAPTKTDDMTATFLRGEPQSLGVVQIFLGVLCTLFSLTALFSPILLLHAPFCLAVTFIISGSLAVAASKKKTLKLVRVCLSWNMISMVFGVGGVAYVCFLLADGPASKHLCETCTRGMWVLDISVYGSRGLLLVLLVLQVCVSITVCVFSVRALRRRSPTDSLVTVMVDGDRAPVCTAASLSDSDVALLDSDGEGPCPSPPNSP